MKVRRPLPQRMLATAMVWLIPFGPGALAQAAGIPGILVRTGKFRAGDDQHPDIRPAAVYDDFAAAVTGLLG